MFMFTATAVANPNIALIKFWGYSSPSLRLPANGSISMNLGALEAQTTVSFDPSLNADSLLLNGFTAPEPARLRVSSFLDNVRRLAHSQLFARVESTLNFPMSAGLASSAAGFAALSLAACAAAGLSLSETALSRLARLGSGSACRSVPGGFVEWQIGRGDQDSFAVSIAPQEHWALVDCVAVVQTEQKSVSSTEGHLLAVTSPLQAARVADAPHRLDRCRRAIRTHDFDALAAVTELDSNLMHAVMMTSTPPLFYWTAESITLMKKVPVWRAQGIPVFYTVDAGPNVHLLTQPDYVETLTKMVNDIPGIQQIIVSPPGGPARLLNAIYRK